MLGRDRAQRSKSLCWKKRIRFLYEERFEIAPYVPQEGYVPDAATAVKIGEAVLLPIYGEKVLKEERPFTARLEKPDVWRVEGTLPEGYMGGTAVVKISKKDGTILFLVHYQ